MSAPGVSDYIVVYDKASLKNIHSAVPYNKKFLFLSTQYISYILLMNYRFHCDFEDTSLTCHWRWKKHVKMKTRITCDVARTMSSFQLSVSDELCVHLQHSCMIS